MKTYKSECNDEQYKLSLKFAMDSYKTNINEYARRNQTNEEKIINDILVGKIAEYAVYNFLIKHGKNCTEPDIKIYDKYQKSFDADLYSDNKRIHVKSQTISSSKEFGSSWSFQKQDILTINPSNDDWICLCSVDGQKIEIRSLKPAKYYISKYKDPILLKLKNIKKVLYLIDL